MNDDDREHLSNFDPEEEQDDLEFDESDESFDYSEESRKEE